MDKYIISLDSKFGIEVCDVQADSVDGVMSMMKHALNHIADFIPVEVCRELTWKKVLDGSDYSLAIGKFSGGFIYVKITKYTGIPEGRIGHSISYKPY